MKKSGGRGLFVGLCIIPTTVLFTLFMVVPTLEVFYYSFFGGFNKFNISGKQFVGIKNYVDLFSDPIIAPKFIGTFQNTILLIVIVTIVTFAFALVYAGILSREKIKGQNFFRIIFYIPNILSVVVISSIFFNVVYDSEIGILNSITNLFNVSIQWKSGNEVVIFSLAIAMIWQAIGYYMVMYMSSMAAIPESIYESASLEGASRVRVFFQITIPLVWTNIRTTLTFFIISTINLSYLFVRAMYGTRAPESTYVLLYYMYEKTQDYGRAMAIGVITFLFSFLLAGIVNAVTKREILEF